MKYLTDRIGGVVKELLVTRPAERARTLYGLILQMEKEWDRLRSECDIVLSEISTLLPPDVAKKLEDKRPAPVPAPQLPPDITSEAG